MKKIGICFAVVFCLFTLGSNAQFYTQGDISVMLQPNGSHDSTICSTQGQMMYAITIQNSFTGDSVKVKDMSGNLIFEEGNFSGQNPWNVMAPIYTAFGSIPDYMITGGIANFFSPETKVISGPDTIYNISNLFFVPVPDPCSYGNVTGQIYIDYNSDCVFNGSDVPLNSIMAYADVSLNSPSMTSTSSNSYSNGSGNYNIQVQESWMTSFNVVIPSQYQFIFPSTACSPPFYNFNSLSQSNVDFSLQCTNNLDVRCAVQSSGVVRPGIPFTLNPYVNNTGCTAASGTLKLVLDPNVVYNSGLSSNPATTVSGDTLFWDYTNLSNISNGMYWNSFFAGVYLTPDAVVNIGDTLCFQTVTNIPVGDVDTLNNTYSICLPVVNSYDPNMKEVSPRGTGVQGLIPLSTSDLYYTIHFQNTGTAVAYIISVIDTLDADLDANSLEILGASHSMIPQWLGPGIVKFNFNWIMLPDSTTNEALSHGFVSYKIKLNNSLPAGIQIENTAHIIFDYNPAIVTNTTLNTLSTLTAAGEMFSGDKSISVYPNPFSDMTTFVISNFNSEGSYSFELTDIIGNSVRSINDINSNSFQLSRNDLQNGIYLYHIFQAGTIVGNGKLVIQ